MKVLILHQHFNTPASGGALRSYYLAKALIDNGHDVVMVTAHKQKKYTIEKVEGIEVHYLPVSYDNRFGFYKRGISFIKYAWQAFQVAGKVKNITVCYAISVPLTVGQAAIWIKRLYKTPFLFEVGDLWPEAPLQMGFIRNKLLKQSLYWLEKRIYQQAETIVALSPSIKTAIEKKAPGKKVWLIPNMADTLFYKPETKNPFLEDKYGVQGWFVVSYIGAVGFANGLDHYVDCALASERAGLKIKFLLCGDGAMINHLKARAHQLKVTNLLFVPFQNREGVREVMNVSDAVFISYRSFPILETGSPNKYFDGLAAGKLIIINFGGWIKEEIEKEHCGINVDVNDTGDFIQKIQPFIFEDSLLRQFQSNARLLAERKYSRSILSAEFVKLFEF